LYGVTKLADNTDLALANRAGNNDVLTAASLTQTNMQAIETAPGVIALATQAEVNGALSSNKAVTPATLMGTPPTCKLWVSFKGQASNGACIINSNFNVSSVSRIAQGRYTITFYNNLAHADYCVVFGNTAGQGGTNGSVYASGGWDNPPTDKTTTTLTVSFGNGSDYRDCYEMNVSIFG